METGPLLEMISDWGKFLDIPCDEETVAAIEQNSRTGRPLGSEAFVLELERLTGRTLRKRKPGPTPGCRQQD